MRRVVAGADRVDVVRLHQQHVAPHDLLGDRAAVVGVELVAVDAAEQDPPAVDLQQPVLDRDAAEADPQRHALARARDLGVVEPGQLGAPRLDGHLHALPRRDVDAERGHGHARGHAGVHAQRPRAAGVVVAGVHEDVVERVRGARDQRDAAEDPRQPPHVLVLEIGACRPLVHPHREDVVLAGAQQRADVELGREPAARADADLDAVEPRPQARVDALEAQHRVAPLPLRRHRERAPIIARGVLVGDVRRLHRERVGDVRVGRRAVAVQLPVRRDSQPVPARVVEPARRRSRAGRPRGRRGGTPSRRRVTATGRPTAGRRARHGCPVRVRSARSSGSPSAGLALLPTRRPGDFSDRRARAKCSHHSDSGCRRPGTPPAHGGDLGDFSPGGCGWMAR